MITDIIAALEATTEGSRELDLRIDAICRPQEGLAFGHSTQSLVAKAEEIGNWDGTYRIAETPHYTTNLQHAVEAIPEGWCGNVDIAPVESSPGCDLMELNTGQSVSARAQTSPLAICIAILKALQAQQEG